MENRTEPRYGLHYRLDIIRNQGEEHFGYVINLSKSGMLIRSTRVVSAADSSQMRLILPHEIDSINTIPMTLRYCWIKPDDESGVYLIGCQITDITSKYFRIMQEILSGIILDSSTS